MPYAAALRQSTRIVFFTAMTAAATFGGIALIHELTASGVPVASPRATAQNAAIAASLAALAADRTSPETPAAAPETASRSGDAELAAQIAAATDRRDLALRHARAIRARIGTGDIASLAEVRDSVVIGQLLSQQTALDLEIAEQGAKFKASHPVMRALQAHRTALRQQIADEAAATATALESEAKLDTAQIADLQTRRAAKTAPTTVSNANVAPPKSNAELQRADLDQLLLTYLNLPASERAAAAPTALLSPLNLVIVTAAALAALVWQVNAALRRRRFRASDLDKWIADRAAESGPAPAEVAAGGVAATIPERRAA